jgi:hypothetical protein
MQINRLIAAAAVIAGSLTTLSLVGAASATTVVPEPGVTGCDSLVTTPVGHDCLLPWPNDAFTKPSSSTHTHRLLSIPSSLTPMNKSGVHISAQYQNLNDGFSPGSTPLIQIPSLSITNSGLATSTNISKSGCSAAGTLTNTAAPIVLRDTVTKHCVPYFAELDAQDPDPTTRLLIIHPATDFLEGHRIVVLLRNLKDTAGHAIPELPGEAAALAGTMTPKSRGTHLKWVVTHDLAGFNLTHLYVAWDFTVISGGGNLLALSASNLADPALSMRQQAFKLVGTTAPVFKVTNVFVNSNSEREVDGMFQVPTFLKSCAAPGGGMFGSTNTGTCGAMSVASNHLPKLVGSTYVKATSTTPASWTNQIWADFICVMPQTVSSSGPAIPTLYGHGLLGDASEVTRGNFKLEPSAHNMMGCATDWTGMSNNDALLVAGALGNLSNFHVNVDHMLQGLVNFQFLGRLINSPKGFASDPAFKSGSQSRFLVGKCNYMGYSQGGIMGGALSAVSTQWVSVVLGQAGLDYGGLLLNRSVDWYDFASFYDAAYTNPVDQQVGLQLIQLLWDRGENDGYAEHLTKNPYGGTLAKHVLIIENYGDHQVTNLSQEVLARTIGALAHKPTFDAVYHLDTSVPTRTEPVSAMDWGIGPLVANTLVKGAIVLWDFGTPSPPTDNEPPVDGTYGNDPHDFGHNNANEMAQVLGLMLHDKIPEVCSNKACQAPPVN